MAYLQALLENLFGAFEFPDSAENPYVMLCVMRVIEFVGPGIQPVAHVCLQVKILSQILSQNIFCFADFGEKASRSVSKSSRTCV